MTPLLATTLTAAAILSLIILIGWVRLNPFVTLFVVSLGLALVTGMPAEQAINAFEAGMGHVLGHVAGVIALGTMLGKILAETGGADQIALTISRFAGKKRLNWAMMVIGLLVGLPVFFEVGFVLLIPLVVILSRRNQLAVPFLAFPMVAALSVTHAMVPPHPAALLAITAYHANTAYTLFWGLVIGTPIATIAGPLYGYFCVPRLGRIEPTALEEQFTSQSPHARLPSFTLSCATLLMPVVLMLGGAVAEQLWPKTALAYRVLHFLGNTDIALLCATLMAFWLLGSLSGLSRETVLRFSNTCLAPTASIMLLVGAGGGFLIIPALIIFNQMPMKRAVGTSLLIIAANSLFGFLGKLDFHLINWTFLLSLSSIAIIGILIGSKLSQRIDGKKLKPAFGWFVLIMGIFIITKELFIKS